jgi:hypothetical protein
MLSPARNGRSTFFRAANAFRQFFHNLYFLVIFITLMGGQQVSADEK